MTALDICRLFEVSPDERPITQITRLCRRPLYHRLRFIFFAGISTPESHGKTGRREPGKERLGVSHEIPYGVLSDGLCPSSQSVIGTIFIAHRSRTIVEGAILRSDWADSGCPP